MVNFKQCTFAILISATSLHPSLTARKISGSFSTRAGVDPDTKDGHITNAQIHFFFILNFLIWVGIRFEGALDSSKYGYLQLKAGQFVEHPQLRNLFLVSEVSS